ncbi:MAG TPA: HdeD family acid-resistance protein [Pusillimonas sp.]|uniref:HdeD family acid-resistance protein n=1 Tax=Pusillimonas sp. TaxID=3040095 RepID=UPI002C94B699|nr:HdeD family acid-resistance protein [Pusillimonas sp.]HUH86488.1 HdeD family acid-resistance protein [Pusillimonas sp.]
MSNTENDSKLVPDQLTRPLQDLGAGWGWFVALGIALLVLGAIGFIYVFAATLASVIFIGALMLAGGIGQLIHAWRVRKLGGFLFWTFSGLLYGSAGVLALVNPVAGASILTLLLGATLIAVGALRLWIWFNNRGQKGWQWLAFSGAITLVTGLLIAAFWPGNSMWLLGLVLAIDLVFQGWSSLLLGLALKKQR